jgi:uncharacterized secreted repeat protein (TIGR03808 family)
MDGWLYIATGDKGVPGATRLFAVGPASIFTAAAARSLTLNGLSFDGQTQPFAAEMALATLADIDSLDIERCDFGGATGTGLSLTRCGGHVRLSRFEALDTALLALDSTHLSISENHVRACTNNGILVHRSQKGYDGTRITGNRIEAVAARGGGLGWFGNGINTYRAGNVLVSDNVIRDCGFSFIRANGCDGIQIVGNNGLKAGETGIYVEFDFEGAVVSGNVVQQAAAGISVVNFDKGGRLASISGNLCRNMVLRPHPETGVPAYGVGIAVEADSVVSGNTVESCEGHGISLGYGPFLRDLVCNGNLVRDCETGIAVSIASDTGLALIASNLLTGNKRGAVIGYAWEKPNTGDLALPGARMPTGITVTGNVAR